MFYYCSQKKTPYRFLYSVYQRFSSPYLLFISYNIQQLLMTGKSSGGHNVDSHCSCAESLKNGYATNEQVERCCGKDGICCHEVLFDGEADPLDQNKMMRKVALQVQPCFLIYSMHRCLYSQETLICVCKGIVINYKFHSAL